MESDTNDALLYAGDNIAELFDKDLLVVNPGSCVASFLRKVAGIPQRPLSCLSYAINILLGFKYFKRSRDIYGCFDYYAGADRLDFGTFYSRGVPLPVED